MALKKIFQAATHPAGARWWSCQWSYFGWSVFMCKYDTLTYLSSVCCFLRRSVTFLNLAGWSVSCFAKRIKLLNRFISLPSLIAPHLKNLASSQPWDIPFSGIPGTILCAAHALSTVEAVSSSPLLSSLCHCVAALAHRLPRLWLYLMNDSADLKWNSTGAALFHLFNTSGKLSLHACWVASSFIRRKRQTRSRHVEGDLRLFVRSHSDCITLGINGN